MVNLKNNYKITNSQLLSLAFEQAKVNLGSTKDNPSVGCIIEKNGSVLSSGRTSFNGRPHAEFNALNRKKNFKNANLYVTLEPCSHYGVTPPCTNLIAKKKINKVYFSLSDFDLRSKNKSKKILKKNNIKLIKIIDQKFGLNFYKSYYLQHNSNLPLIDIKIAISKDLFTVNKKNQWITNFHSQRRAHLIRSTYNCIISTSKSINNDNSLLNCRIDGLEKKSPDLIILDRNLKLKRNLKLFNIKTKRKIYIFTTSTNKKKISFFKKKGIKIIILGSLKTRKDYNNFFYILKKKKYSRILIEAGVLFTNFLIKNKFIHNLYLFKSNTILKNNGSNIFSNKYVKEIKSKNKIQVNLFSDKLYKIKIKKNV